MPRTIVILSAVAAVCAAALALPGDLVVVSDKDVLPDEAAGLYYLGSCAGGFLYSGSAASLGAVGPYRLLDEGARGKHYFLVSLPSRTALTAADLAAAGEVRPLGDDYLLAVVRPGDVGLLLAREPRLRLRELRPTVRVGWKAAAEAPPTRKDLRIEEAIKTITAEEYASYILQLQNYGTRYSFTPEMEAARNWLRNWFAGHNVTADWHAFDCGRYERAHYPEVGGNLYLDDYHCMIRRSQDGGANWDTLRPRRGTAGWYYDPPPAWWLDGDTGFVAGIDGYVALTTDGGDSWECLRYAPGMTGGFRVIRGMAFATPRLGWISYVDYRWTGSGYAATPHFAQTENGGQSWREVNWTLYYFSRLVPYDARRMWALRYAYGEGTRFHYSNDGGSSCPASTSSTPRRWVPGRPGASRPPAASSTLRTA